MYVNRIRPVHPAYRAALGDFAHVLDALSMKLVHATRYLAHLHAVVHTLQANLAVIVGAEFARERNKELVSVFFGFAAVIVYGLLPGFKRRIILTNIRP